MLSMTIFKSSFNFAFQILYCNDLKLLLRFFTMDIEMFTILTFLMRWARVVVSTPNRQRGLVDTLATYKYAGKRQL